MIDIEVGSVPSHPKGKVPNHLNAHQIYSQGWLAILLFCSRGEMLLLTQKASAE